MHIRIAFYLSHMLSSNATLLSSDHRSNGRNTDMAFRLPLTPPDKIHDMDVVVDTE